MTETKSGQTDVDVYDRLVTRLAAAHHQHQLAALGRWQYGQTTQPMAVFSSLAGTPSQVRAFSTVTAAFARWHQGHPQPVWGQPGLSLGGALRRAGHAGQRGPSDPQASRALRRLLAAETWPDMHEAVVRAALVLDPACPPRWAQLAADLDRWQQTPQSQHQVRNLWAYDFNHYTPTQPTKVKDPS